MRVSLPNFRLLNRGYWRVFWFVLLASVAGFTVNLFPVFLFGEMTLIFGSAFSLLVAFTVGRFAGALVALVASIALIYSWDNYYGFFLFIPEAIIVGHLYRRGWNELLAVAVYWLIVAIPFVIGLVFVLNDSKLAIDLVGKYLMNSFMYTLMASALNWFFSIPKRLNLKFNRPFTLRTQIFTILMVSMMLPVVAFSLYYAQKYQQEHLDLVQQKLKVKVDRVAQGLDNFLTSHRLIIQKQAEVLSSLKSNQKLSTARLIEFHRDNQYFSTMIIADLNGDIKAFSPSTIKLVGNMNVKDRDYFVAAKMGNVFISQAFRGRGFGVAPIVAISAPIFARAINIELDSASSSQGPGNNQVVSILEGTLDLNDLKKIIESRELIEKDELTQLIIITDAENKVVLASDGIGRNYLDVINWDESASQQVPGFYNTEFIDDAIISNSKSLPNGWQIKSFYRAKDFTEVARQKYRTISLVLILTVVGVGLLAAFLSYQINGPISWLLKKTLALNVVGKKVPPVEISPYVPSEMAALMRAHESAERRLQMAFETEKMHQKKRINAEKANEAKSDFLSSMSHELRTPLNAISGFSQLLAMEDSLNDELKGFVNEINIASLHLLSLINDILDMSKIESGKLLLHKEQVDVGELLDQTLPLLKNQAKARQVSITFKSAEKKLYVIADKLRLKQAIINLLSNAIKYNQIGGDVLISLHDNGEQSCALKVIDTGVGIAQERLNELFKVFNRLDQEGSDIDGHGIGLAITKKLVEMMGGSIRVTSEVNKGSCFCIYLPIVKASAEVDHLMNSSLKTQSASINPCRVLYVEDNNINALVMKKAMGQYAQIDYVREANGHSALSRVEREYFDFVLLDISLPDMSGYEILSILQRDFSQQYRYVFAVSANAMSEDISKGLSAGFDKYVTKPVKFDQLFELIEIFQQITDQT